ncbi:RagB/SusD family nutrient uptake outer membrane protein [Bacteroides sp. 519]|uniref:RagB/SusD family nutrient uptake outer membrane protein n=1 Tax=Bacteroides sp. 519 TaxID=2302937 RepID=UPI0013D05163|nr:RagB/SusD family nutrient uptake outer membrane protein [Bacteroides sp. 519]NDV57725.1 RagB/SusD family nutrient uptake outer membrane protein [Bacteroides sp. 519]
MKLSIIKSILPVALLALAASCTDLDVDIKSQYTEFPDSEDAVDAISGSVYSSYRGTLGRDHWFCQMLSSDEAVAVSIGGDYFDGGRYRDLALHSWTPDHGMIPSMWNSAMNGINTCNSVLAQLGDDESNGAAPIRAMRAYYYFILMDNFGDAPIMTSMGGGQPDRSPRADVCKFVEEELLAVLDRLTTTVDGTTYGKATRYMAEALLAKVYLNWALYTASDVANYNPTDSNPKLNDAVKMCDAIIASGKFNLNDSFWSKFLPTNGAHIKDFIFVMPYDRVTQRGMTYARFWTHREGRSQFDHKMAGSVGGTLRVLPEYYDKFNLEGDDRNNIWLTGKQYYWKDYAITSDPLTINTTNSGVDQFYSGSDKDASITWHVELTKEIYLRPELGNPEETLNAGSDLIGKSMGYRSIKFYMDPNTTSDDGRSQSNDVPIFRYADVLLMKAEAILRGATATNGDTPMSLLNQIRAYVHAPEITTAPTLDDILDERAREFSDESWRRNDLIRFGKFEDLWGLRSIYAKSATEKFRRIFPLPTEVMNTNTNWKQNAGY